MDSGLATSSRPGMTKGTWMLPASQKALRIDVDFQLEIAFGLRCGGEPFAQIVRQVEAARGLQQQAEPVTALDHRQWCLRRTQHLHVLVTRGQRNEAPRKAFGAGA